MKYIIALGVAKNILLKKSASKLIPTVAKVAKGGGIIGAVIEAPFEAYELANSYLKQ